MRHVRTSKTRSSGSLLRAEDGAVAAIVGLGLPVFLGLAALAVDVSQWYGDKRELQTATDAAAIGAALELTHDRSSNMTTQAHADAARNGATIAGTTTLALHWPPTSGPRTGDNHAVEVILTRPAHRMLSSGLFSQDPTVRARAVALVGNTGDGCVLGLQEVNIAVLVSGNADVVLSCGVASNADLKMNGNSSQMTATSATVGGSVTGFSQNLDVPPAATQENAPTMADPYSDLAVPSPKPGNGSISGSSTKTYSPGTFNSSISISNGTYNFQPGVYVLNNASLTITGGTITGTGVTFIFTGSSASTVGKLDIHGNPNVNLTAPPTGDYAGVAFFQDHIAQSGVVNKINGTSNIHITGAVYFPSQELQFQGNNTTGGGGGCTQLVASKVTFTGNSNFGFDCEDTGIHPIGAARVALVE